MLPVVMSFITKLTVSLGFSMTVVITDTLDAPTKFKAPCIWAFIPIAASTANTRVNILFILFLFFCFIVVLCFMLTFTVSVLWISPGFSTLFACLPKSIPLPTDDVSFVCL